MMFNTIGAVSLGIRDILDQNPMIGEAKRGSRRAWTNKEISTLRFRIMEDAR